VNSPQADHPEPAPPAGALDRALALVEFLRAHCPWDAAQTPHSLRRYLLEESHEVVDAIELGDEEELRGELGDLLLNLAFQVVLGEERGAFDREAVVAGLEHKMRRRHPHLFGLGEAEPWETLKAREREAAGPPPEAGLLDDLPPGHDPLQRAHRIQEIVSRVGFDWPDWHGAWEKVHEEVEEVGVELEAGRLHEVEEELGDLLFAIVNLARLSGVHAPAALSRANAKFIRRFAEVERLARLRGIVVEDAGLEALDRLWDEAKRSER
jgi:MazG family protein